MIAMVMEMAIIMEMATRMEMATMMEMVTMLVVAVAGMVAIVFGALAVTVGTSQADHCVRFESVQSWGKKSCR